MAATAKVQNYTAEQTAFMVEAYSANPSSATVEMLAVKFGKTARSIIAKLSREKVYVAKTYETKNGEKPVKKDSVADAIGNILGMTDAEKESLAKANKTALQKVFNALANSKPI